MLHTLSLPPSPSADDIRGKYKQSGKNVNRSCFHICMLFSICTHELITLLFLVMFSPATNLKHTLHICARFHSSCHPKGTVPGMPQHFSAWSSQLNYSREYTNLLPFLPTLENPSLIWVPDSLNGLLLEFASTLLGSNFPQCICCNLSLWPSNMCFHENRYLCPFDLLLY